MHPIYQSKHPFLHAPPVVRDSSSCYSHLERGGQLRGREVQNLEGVRRLLMELFWTVGCVPKMTGWSLVLTSIDTISMDALIHFEQKLTSKRSKYSLTSKTNCSERSSPCGNPSAGPSV